MGAAMLAESAEIGQYDDLTGMLVQVVRQTVAEWCMCEDGFDPYRWETMAGMRSETVPKSRTQLKKEAISLQRLGEKLIALSDDQLARMELPALLIEAIQAIRTMRSHGAQRRQVQYIGALMRNIDVAPIQRALLEIEQGAYRLTREFHRSEAWRDRLVGGDDAVFDEIVETVPDVNRQRLGQLVRSARKEKRKNGAPTSARKLFRYLKQVSTKR
jgi:ribosome-associated protein